MPRYTTKDNKKNRRRNNRIKKQKQTFSPGDKVEWNWNRSSNISILTKKPHECIWSGPYDFGRYVKGGNVLLYMKVRGMQSSFIVSADKIRKYRNE